LRANQKIPGAKIVRFQGEYAFSAVAIILRQMAYERSLWITPSFVYPEPPLSGGQQALRSRSPQAVRELK
jgi:hypothetical protein